MAANQLRVALAYSGGLDTSVMVHWLRKHYDAEVVCITADVGQGEELSGLEQKALASGASSFVLCDLVEEFVRDFVFVGIQANAVYEGGYLLGTALARPVIAKGLVEAARACGAQAIAHGATGKGNDQVRFELTAYALWPDVKVIAPWREWAFCSRDDLLAYAAEQGVDVPVTAAKPYSMDRNLMHLSYEGGVLEDPWVAPPEDMFLWTCTPQEAPDVPEEITIDFVDGIPVAVDAAPLSPAALLAELNDRAARHGIGRLDIVENRYVGMKSRGVYETPGASILHPALRAVESLTLDREVLRLRDELAVKFAEIIYYGYWFAPEGRHLRTLIQSIHQGVTGSARLRLYKGSAAVCGRRAPASLYREDFATFGEDDVYDQSDAEGFIRLHALRLRLQAMVPGR